MGVGHNGLTEDLQSPLQFILQVSELPRQHFPAVFFKEIWTIFMLKPIHWPLRVMHGSICIVCLGSHVSVSHSAFQPTLLLTKSHPHLPSSEVNSRWASSSLLWLCWALPPERISPPPPKIPHSYSPPTCPLCVCQGKTEGGSGKRRQIVWARNSHENKEKRERERDMTGMWITENREKRGVKIKRNKMREMLMAIEEERRWREEGKKKNNARQSL